jgi:hypothetical protein
MPTAMALLDPDATLQPVLPDANSTAASCRAEGGLRRQVFNYGVGFTAILTKALLHDRRFWCAVRSVPVTVELRRRHRTQSHDPATMLPPELARLQWRGMLRGPGRYVRSAYWSRRRGLRNVVYGGATSAGAQDPPGLAGLTTAVATGEDGWPPETAGPPPVPGGWCVQLWQHKSAETTVANP